MVKNVNPGANWNFSHENCLKNPVVDIGFEVLIVTYKNDRTSKAQLFLFQLPQVEQDGTDGRRFRVENGDSPGEKEEVTKKKTLSSLHTSSPINIIYHRLRVHFLLFIYFFNYTPTMAGAVVNIIKVFAPVYIPTAPYYQSSIFYTSLITRYIWVKR